MEFAFLIFDFLHFGQTSTAGRAGAHRTRRGILFTHDDLKVDNGRAIINEPARIAERIS